MQNEINDIHSNGMWSLVPSHPSINVIGICRVYKINGVLIVVLNATKRV
jgi:hypothetical protein